MVIREKIKTFKFRKKHIAFLFKLALVLFVLILTILNAYVFYEFGDINTTEAFADEGFTDPITSDQTVRIDFTVSRNRIQRLMFRLAAPVVGKDDDLGIQCEIQNQDGLVIQSDVFDLETIVSSIGNVIIPIRSNLEKGQTYSLYISSTQSRPGKAYRLKYGNPSHSDVEAWFMGDQEKDSFPDVDILYGRFDRVYFAMIFILLGGAAASLFLPALPKPKLKLAYHISLLLISPACVLYVTEKLNFNTSISSLKPGVLLFNYFILLAFFAIIYGISNRFSIAIISASTLLLLLAVINHFVLLFRSTVFLPGDIFGMTAAANVAKGYRFIFMSPVLQAIALWVFLICTSTRDVFIAKNKRYRIGGIAFAVLFTGLTAASVSVPDVYERAGVSLDWWRQTNASKENGFFANFAVNIPGLIVTAPSQYNVKNISESLTPQVESIQSDIIRPNLLVIMNESFADFSIAGDTKASEDPLKYMRTLAEDDNPRTFVGNVIVPVYGANTNCSEFEMLTGFSVLFNNSIAPFAQYIHRETPSVASRLSELGYETMVSHPGEPGNWDRERVLPLLGFEQIYFDRDFGKRNRLRNFVTDKSSYDFVIEKFEEKNDAPLYHYNLTIQNHGGYETMPEKDKRISVNGSNRMFPQAEEYFTLLKHSDNALEGLFSYFDNVDEPVLIMLFGDHWGAVETEYIAMLQGADMSVMSRRQMMTLHTTPLIFWANYDVDYSLLPEYVSSNYLSAILLHLAELPLTAFDEFLLQSMAQYPVISEYGFVNANDEYSEGMPPEAQHIVETYKMIQYNGLFDHNKRVAELFSYP